MLLPNGWQKSVGFTFLVDWQRAQHSKKENIIFFLFSSLQLSLWCFTVSVNHNTCTSFSPNGNYCFLWGREKGLIQPLSVERHWAQTWLPAWGGSAPAPSHSLAPEGTVTPRTACWSVRGHQAWNTHTVALLFRGETLVRSQTPQLCPVCEGKWGLKHTLWLCTVCEGTPRLPHTAWPCLICEGASGLLNTPWQCPVCEGHWHSRELFLSALKSFTYRLPPTQFIFCCWGGREEGLPWALPALRAEAMASPGWFAASQQGHRALPRGLLRPASTRAAALHAPGWQRRNSWYRDWQTKGKDAKSQTRHWWGRGDALVAAALLLPLVLSYRLLPRPSPFPEEIMSILLSQVNWFVFQVQLVSATTTMIFRTRALFIRLFLRYFRGNRGSNEHFLQVDVVALGPAWWAVVCKCD